VRSQNGGGVRAEEPAASFQRGPRYGSIGLLRGAGRIAVRPSSSEHLQLTPLNSHTSFTAGNFGLFNTIRRLRAAGFPLIQRRNLPLRASLKAARLV
jgi:hypothetical protein